MRAIVDAGVAGRAPARLRGQRDRGMIVYVEPGEAKSIAIGPTWTSEV
jgi:hypothetical protein